MKTTMDFMHEAVLLAQAGVDNNQGGPFGALIVCNGKIIAKGNNQVTSHNDPTAHAEVVAIRQACAELNDFSLKGCEIYTSCEPCPMCLAAIYWARIDKIYYAANRTDTTRIGFDDEFLYQELKLNNNERTLPIIHLPSDEIKIVFANWLNKKDKVMY